MRANGKADLYFHAYFWDKYLNTLQTESNSRISINAVPPSPKKNKKSKDLKEEIDEDDYVSKKLPEGGNQKLDESPYSKRL